MKMTTDMILPVNGVRFMLVAVAMLLSAKWLPAARSQNAVELSRSSLDCGGVMRATGDEFELSGTIGQPDAGRMAGGNFTLTGGFWFELVAGDCDEDGGMSISDLNGFTGCLTGPFAPTDEACWCGDLDGNGHADLRDVAEFQNGYVAP